MLQGDLAVGVVGDAQQHGHRLVWLPQRGDDGAGRWIVGGGGRYRALGPSRFAILQTASWIGRIDPFEQIHRRSDDLTALGVEDQYLAQVRDDQEPAGLHDLGCGGGADDGFTPPNPLGRGEGDHGSGLAHVEVVIAVGKRPGPWAPGDHPGAPTLACRPVVLPLHQCAAGWGVGADRDEIVDADGGGTAYLALGVPAPLQSQLTSALSGRVAAVVRVSVGGGPSGCCFDVDPRIVTGTAGDGEECREGNAREYSCPGKHGEALLP
ncbi:Uncharacterised protein [Mycobacteroides abscessus]|nr:Uncharacterised protein [Mycobacteroides abscessus]